MSDSLFFVGAGSVGGSLALALFRAGRRVLGVYSRSAGRAAHVARLVGAAAHQGPLPRDVGEAGVVIAAVPDRAIADVAAAASGLCSPAQIWLHCSGSLGASALDGLRSRVRGVGSFHPAIAFPPGLVSPVPAGARFATDGDPAALAVAADLASAMNGVAVHVPEEARPAYHAAAVLASNDIVALVAEARSVLASSGVPTAEIEPLLLALARSALDRALDNGLDASLTGPVRRGDTATVRLHLAALSGSPGTLDLYRAAGRAALRLARRLGDIDERTASEIASILGEDSSSERA